MLTVAIVTRNAIHGGVESMIAMHQRYLNAMVFVAGGYNRPDTCPFRYVYLDDHDPVMSAQRLLRYLRGFDVIIYHWLPEWAVEAVRAADRPCIEFVHRDDTSENDKTVPDAILTHSQYLADFIRESFSRSAFVAPHGIDTERFVPGRSSHCVGGLSSYVPTKGISTVLDAWAVVEHQLPSSIRLRYYGSGPDLPVFEHQVREKSIKRVELLGPTLLPERHLPEFSLFVQPSIAEGLPIAILEALACDIPVIGSEIDPLIEFNRLGAERGFPDLLQLVRPGDVYQLADTIRESLDAPERRGMRAYISKYYGPAIHMSVIWDGIRVAMSTRAKVGSSFAVGAASRAGNGR